jgi:hypothetical protein
MKTAACLVLLGVLAPAAVGDETPRKKIVLIAGKKSHGPVGNGIHDYGWSVQLLKVMLDYSNVRDRVRVEVHQDGWPRDPRKLEHAEGGEVVEPPDHLTTE